MIYPANHNSQTQLSFRYVTIQRGSPAAANEVSNAETPRFGGGSRGSSNSQVGSSNLISRFGSAQNALRTRLLRQPRDRVAALKEQGQRRRRSPESVSIVYPSPSLNSLSTPEVILEAAEATKIEDVFIPSLPVKADIAYVFPQSKSHVREKKQVTLITTTAEPETSTLAEATTETEVDENEDDYDYEIVNVSVSKSVSESFSVSKLLDGIYEVVTTTLTPLFGSSNEEETEGATMEVPTITTKTSTQLPVTTSTTFKVVTTTVPKLKKDLKSFFKPNARVHPFLASKSAAVTTTTTERTTTRRSFLLKKTLPSLNPLKVDKSADKDDKHNLDMKLMKMMNILNSRDAKEEMKETPKKELNESENIIEDDKESTEEQINTTEKIDFLLANRNERPKFQVPPSLQAKLLQEAAIETVSTTASPAEKEAKSEVTALRSPLKLFNKKPSLIRPFKPRKSPITEKPIELPKRSGIVRPQKPLDLDVSPSRTITRARSSLRRPSLGLPSQEVTVTATTSSSTEASTVTEKLTVGEILAELHGEGQVEPRTSTLRPHSFRPKLDTSRLRERLRQQLEESDENAIEDVENGNLDSKAASKTEPEEVEENQDRSSNKESLLSSKLPFGRGNERRVISRPSRPSVTQQPLRTSSQPLRPRRPIGRKQALPAKLPSPFKTAPVEEEPVLQEGERVLSGQDLLSSLGIDMSKEVSEPVIEEQKPEIATSKSMGILESLILESSGNQSPNNAENGLFVTPPQEKIPESPLSIDQILKSAVVESVPLPPKKVEVNKNKKIETNGNLPRRLVTNTRSRTRPVPHRLRPTLSQPSSSIPTRAPSTTRANPSTNTVINNRRLRVRQRGRVVSTSTDKPATTVEIQNNQGSTNSQTVAPSTTRASSRFQNRRRIVNRRPSTSTEASTTNSEAQNAVSKTTQRASFGTRTGNLRTSSRVNNKLRVRSRSRSRQPVTESAVAETADESAVEDTGLATRTSPSQPTTNQQNLGKFEETQTTSIDNTTPQIETLANAEENAEDNAEEKAEENEEKSTLRPAIFKPRFGSKQRNSVRNRLRSQLSRNTDSTTIATTEKSSFSEENLIESSTASFQTVSPGRGLNSVPASFFTTTPRFFKISGDVTTELPDIFSDNAPKDFLPTLTPLQRVGRSTVGYDVPPTEKPRFSLLKKPLRPKFGQRKNGITPKPIFKLQSTTESILNEIDNEIENEIDTLKDNLRSTTTEASTTESTSESTPESISESTSKKPTAYKKKKSGWFNRPRVDFLKQFEAKIGKLKEDEQKLFQSFGSSPNKKASKRPLQASKGIKNDIDALKRPRRRFNLGISAGNKGSSLKNDPKLNEITTTLAPTKEAENTTISEAIIETTTEVIKSSPKTKPKKLKGKQPKFPKGFKLPFDTNRFGPLQPKLLSFKIIKGNSKTTTVKTTTVKSTTAKPTTTGNDVTESDEEEEEQVVTEKAVVPKKKDRKSGIRDKLKFGRKAFGALLKPNSRKNRYNLIPTPRTPRSTTPAPAKPAPTAPKNNSNSNTSTTPDTETTQVDLIEPCNLLQKLKP